MDQISPEGAGSKNTLASRSGDSSYYNEPNITISNNSKRSNFQFQNSTQTQNTIYSTKKKEETCCKSPEKSNLVSLTKHQKHMIRFSVQKIR
jgi:hypothetical protein